MVVRPTNNRSYFGVVFLALIGFAWLALILWGGSPYGRFLSHDELGEIGMGLSPKSAGLTVVFVMGWSLMTVAMMLPTSLPLFNLFQRLIRQRADSLRLTALLIVGYITVWSTFGLGAHVVDRGIHLAVEQTAWLENNSWVLVAAILLMAGAYQFTSLKYICLDKCRSPLSFITEHWHGSNQGSEAFKLGIHHGAFCVGCCWSLMLLMFAVGMGNLGWMLGLGAVMAVEKNMPWGRRISAPLGVALVVSAVVVALVSGPSAYAHHGSC